MEFELRKWRIEDIENVALYANNEKIANNLRDVFPNPYTLTDAQWYVNHCMEKDEDNQITRAIVVDGKAVGSIGVFVGSDVYAKSAELGYWLGEEFWGNGIVTQAILRICQEAFRMFDIVRIYAEPFEHNMGSRRVLEKAGFTLEGIMRDGVCKNGNIFGYYMYSLLLDESSN